MLQKPSIGRIVLAVIKDLRGELVTRPAIVTRTWGDSFAVQATVFPDMANDGLGATVAKSSLRHDESGIVEDAWHWPRQELPMAAEAIELCRAIERLPASGEVTALSVLASNLAHHINLAATPQS